MPLYWFSAFDEDGIYRQARLPYLVVLGDSWTEHRTEKTAQRKAMREGGYVLRWNPLYYDSWRRLEEN